MKFMVYIKNLFRKKYTITFHFKSGATLTAKAYTFNIQKPGNELTKIEHEWVGNGPLYIRLDDISAITYK